MKIGFYIPYASVNYSGGINVQGRMWAEGLRELGHETYLLNNWDKFDYEHMDYIIILGIGKLVSDMVSICAPFKNLKLISAPIIDDNIPYWKYKLLSRIPVSKRLYGNPTFGYRKSINKFSYFLVRSEYEKQYLINCYGVSESKIGTVPISMRYTVFPEVDYARKENFCFHVSRLASPNKNVASLIEAAKKYKFNLKLAGTLNGKEQKEWLASRIDGCSNIEYLGWLSEEELARTYERAKAFALPSFTEGVGMVALEAAVYGSEIVMTNIGAPKEYYEGRSVLVNPYDIDSIGNGVLEALNSKNSQPELRNYIINNYSTTVCMRKLEQILQKI